MQNRWAHRRALALVLVALMLVAVTPLAGFAADTAAAEGVGALIILPEDAYEADDTTATATVYDPDVMGNSWTSLHTFHDLGDHDGVAEQSDYVEVTIEDTGTPIFVENQRVGQGFYDPMLYILEPDGTQVAYDDDSDVWWNTYSSNLYYVAPAPGTYYVLAENNGDDCYAYFLHITLGDARRIAGDTRIDTAVAVTSRMYDNTNSPSYGTDYGPNKILVANGYAPWDALAGGAAAAASLSDGSVLLLTHPGYLPEATYNEIVRLTESQYWYDNDDIEIFVLGGPAAVGDAVLADLEMVPGVTNVERIAGDNRFETAAEIGALIDNVDGVSTTAFVVSGYAWPDAVSASAVAGYNDSAVLMTMKDDVPDVTMDWITDMGITNVVVVGGASVIDGAVDELETALGAANVEVLAGANRYETSRLVAQYGVDEFGMEDTNCQLVSGENFPDALASASMAAMTEAPTLLTKPGYLHDEVVQFFDDAGAIGYNYDLGDTNEGWGSWVIGGESAVSDAAYAEFRDLWMMFED